MDAPAIGGKGHVRASDVRGLGQLTIEGIAGLTRLVEALHQSILRAPGIFGTSPSGPTTGITGLVYRSVRGATALVGGGLDAALAQLVRMLGETSSSRSSPEREAVLAALNGVLGDYLADSGSPLAIAMRLRRDGQPLDLQTQALATAIPQLTGKLLVLVHGLCMNDLQWDRPGRASDRRGGDAVGRFSVLARDLGCTAIYLHYNSGRHISTNGREFAALMQTLIEQWPVPLEELVIVAHSMGGLVARSACHYGAAAGYDWPRHLRKLIFLGTPHHGAPLARGGHWVDMLLEVSPYTAPFARLGKIRSAGITDLRNGNLLDEDWAGRDRFERAASRPHMVPLPDGVRCYAMAATIGKQGRGLGDRLLGDGLVPVASALGRHHDSSLSLPIPLSRQWVGDGINHLELLHRPAVHRQLKRWLV